jgi:hypothetical protein
MEATAPLSNVSLGDVVTLPDGRAHSVRALATWRFPVEDIAGFVLLGEMSLLLDIPVSGRPLDVYIPVDKMSTPPSSVQSVCDGVVRYWSPHLPSISGALPELSYRVLSSVTRLDPVFVLYREEEAIMFVRAGQLKLESLRTHRMPRSTSEQSADRHSATLTPVPAYVPSENIYDRLTSR